MKHEIRLTEDTKEFLRKLVRQFKNVEIVIRLKEREADD